MAEELDVKGLGLTMGAIFAIYTVVLGITTMMTGWGEQVFNLLASLYIGYTPDPLGIMIGAVWALVDGAILGLLTAWLYNHFKGRI